MRETLINGLEQLNIPYSDSQLDLIDTFYEMLVEKNKVMNLTRITDREDYYVKHVLDSLLVTRVCDLNDKYILDVGTGAGFPGIPIKIFFPDTRLLLLDSVNKKLLFIEEVIDKLGLKNISVIHGRAEDLGHDNNYREKYDIAVSRAVADMSVLSELCIPFVRINGEFIAYKSSDSDDEIKSANNAIKILADSDIIIFDEKIPNTDISRKLIRIIKESPTPKKYPRKPGIPFKNSL